VREVFAEIGADRVPELVVSTSPTSPTRWSSRGSCREPHAVVCSARTGEGIDELLAKLEPELPRPQVDVEVLLPYDRGDLVSQIHENGEILSTEHTGDGTLITARVNAGLAGALEQYAVASA
jgi:GTP-binding protein HflX